MRVSDTIIAFHYTPAETNREASLLASNLAQWGDRFRYMLHWVFEIESDNPQAKSVSTFPKNQETFFVHTTPNISQFPLAAKVIAAAEAETLAEQAGAPLLIWLDPDTLFIHEPLELLLTETQKAALTPVQLRNISSIFSEPMNEYWDAVYTECGVSKQNIYSLETSADQQLIRAHFNAGLISVKPQLGLLRKWRDNFLKCFTNPVIESFYDVDIRYKFFIHQAVLAATLLANTSKDEIKLLPSTYNFPVFLLNKMDPSLHPSRLNELVTMRYDDFDHPNWPFLLPVEEPFKSWLSDAVDRASKA